MNQPLEFVRPFDPASITTLLLDADDNLFPSEAPAFDASADVTTQFLARFGVNSPLSGDELRKKAVGKNFRSTATDLAVLSGVPFETSLADKRPDAVVATEADLAEGRALTADELEQWVRKEREQVTAHLAVTLRPDPEVLGPLQDLAPRFAMAAVSSSALVRLKASFTAAGLDELIPEAVRFSAEDSLAVPVSKPDPAVYLQAGRILGVDGPRGLAVEDSVPGVSSAVAAGYYAVGNVMFVPADEKRSRTKELLDAGAVAVTDSWRALADSLILAAVTTGGSALS
ncbi:HAD family phosphatase [Candidatus Mycobacterium wuenschmannii]|uniref:HAD family phosphatase n=1 Tax=Candidatus Mycobacterium wuenschmannii TaxID=3027808 RepID=A0ABY8VQG6_9MYCO|nr:HAD family phosphatase [Candidatus Mycobacterium wuenschmannii]WIM85875.1 HAD family phosphatase [Candidatus Mycobacterium wuenschmannii]